MSTEHQPSGVAIPVTLPSDGDDGAAASVNDGLQDLAANIAFLRRAISLNFHPTGATLAFTFSGGRIRGGVGGLGSVAGGIPKSGRWIFVGDDDGASAFISQLSSAEGIFQPAHTNPKAFPLRAVAYEPVSEQFIAVGDADGVDAYVVNSGSFTSTAWTERPNPRDFDLLAIATDGAGVVVAAGEHDGTDQYAVRSTDAGDTWSEVSIPGAAGDLVNSIASNGSLFVAVGTSSGGAPLIWTSADGTTWTSRTPAAASTAGLNSVVHNGSVFAAGGDALGEIQTSSDGITWTLRALSVTIFGVEQIAADVSGIMMVKMTGSSGDLNHVSVDDGVTWEPISVIQDGAVLAGSDWGFAIARNSTTFASGNVSLVSF